MKARAFVIATALAASPLLAQEHGHEPHWGYETAPGAVGPEGWGKLPGDSECALGKRQSPIDLTAGEREKSDTPPLAFDYRPSPLKAKNNGHTVQVDVPPGSTVSLGGKSYRLAQLHFHAPSEHTVEGRRMPMEIHLVHVDEAGKPALVVGVLVKEGKANEALAPLFAHLPGKEGEAVAPRGATIDPAKLLPASRDVYRYEGSLTTPPCSEGVSWNVMESPVELSKEQIAAYAALPHLARTARPVQPLNGRKVERTGTP